MTFTFTKTPTSLKSSTLLLFAQNSSKLFICSNPGIRSHVGTERINLVCLQKKITRKVGNLVVGNFYGLQVVLFQAPGNFNKIIDQRCFKGIQGGKKRKVNSYHVVKEASYFIEVRPLSAT